MLALLTFFHLSFLLCLLFHLLAHLFVLWFYFCFGVFRVLFRLALFRNSGYRMVLHGDETSNVDNESEHSSSPFEDGNSTKYGEEMAAHSCNNLAQNRAPTALSALGENARMVSEPMWLHRMQHQRSTVKPSCTNIH